MAIVESAPRNQQEGLNFKPTSVADMYVPVVGSRKGMGASYLGLFAKTFMASSRDGNYKSKSKRAHQAHTLITRDENNQLGLDPCYE